MLGFLLTVPVPPHLAVSPKAKERERVAMSVTCVGGHAAHTAVATGVVAPIPFRGLSS
jgi:hypothetical protein